MYLENIGRITPSLDVIEGASKYIKKLKQDGHTIYIISGRDNGEYTDPYNMTKNWLEKYDITYDKLFLVDAYNSHSKTEICLENNVDIMIDDDWKIIKKLTENKIKTLYFRDTNLMKLEENEYIKEVNNWGDIYRYIRSKD